ncbi:hypothetical protein RCL1_006836 [Eukaryota sp. TZLM3-RCL]
MPFRGPSHLDQSLFITVKSVGTPQKATQPLSPIKAVPACSPTFQSCYHLESLLLSSLDKDASNFLTDSFSSPSNPPASPEAQSPLCTPRIVSSMNDNSNSTISPSNDLKVEINQLKHQISVLLTEIEQEKTSKDEIQVQLQSLRNLIPDKRPKTPVIEFDLTSKLREELNLCRKQMEILHQKLEVLQNSNAKLINQVDYCSRNHGSSKLPASMFSSYVGSIRQSNLIDNIFETSSSIDCSCKVCCYLKELDGGDSPSTFPSSLSLLTPNTKYQSITQSRFVIDPPKFDSTTVFPSTVLPVNLYSSRWKAGTRRKVLPIGRHSSLS